jgi:3-methyladenine DNA glycosylase/8-oxoguanine DNA glycosylase
VIDYTRARRLLMRRDPKLAVLIKRIGPCGLPHAVLRDPFVALTRSIASQQLSMKAAETIFNRLCDLCPPDRQPTPERLLALSEDQIRAVGYSRPKAGFLKDLAARVVDGRLDLHGLNSRPDEDVLQELTAVKGIGRWTAEIFLMFRLGRPDVLPADDLGLLNATQRAYGLRKRPTPDRLRKMGEAWRPYRSVAAWYLWTSLTK